ncbi:MAG: hypothetical protein H8D67_08795 [Deltaproteobacteria bacterium]|nr:hypothetical protein [Deltaproteobacteria bacterium]
MTEKKKFNCYQCKYRGTIPGDAHSRCNHPEVSQDDNEFGALVEMLQGKNKGAMGKLGIKGHPQGIRAGWFSWPANFDPTWLLNCDGFEPKEKEGIK